VAARRRERTDLYAEVLEVVRRSPGRARITRISYGVGMPVDRLKLLLGQLATLGLVARRSEGEGERYELTPRGREFLDVYWRMRAILGLIEGSPAPEFETARYT
jgi:predicted transcriptional regulator